MTQIDDIGSDGLGLARYVLLKEDGTMVALNVSSCISMAGEVWDGILNL